MIARIRLILLPLLLGTWLALAAPGAAQPAFPELTGRVVDQGQLLSPERERALDQRLSELEDETGHQLVVVTVADLQGLSIEDYGYQLGRAWAIGQGDRDNGALLIVAPVERKVRIEVGYGLEPILTDALSARIIHDDILPAFRVGGFERGIDQGVDALIVQLTLDPETAVARAAEAERAPPRLEWGVLIIMGVMILFGILAAIGSAQARQGRGRRRRGRRDGLAPILIWAASEAARSHKGGSGGFGGGFGGFSGGGGSFGGGGASGGW